MTSCPFRFELLDVTLDRTLFSCGENVLDRYFQTQATQDMRRRVAKCFLAIEAATGQVAAYYTLSAASISLVDLPADEAKRLPRYPTLPAVRIGRLAVDQKFQGRGLGAALLMNATDRTLQADAAAFALLVDAKNDRAVGFYRHYGFTTPVSRPRTLFLALKTAQKVFHR
jgi:ribosomal protein S18 acetylase RimI-like enzyme